MHNKTMNFYRKKNYEFGSMLMELLLSLALAMAAIPFVFQYQERALTRAQNIVIQNQINDVQTALERYIIENRESLLATVGKNITRVNISQLADYGISSDVAENADMFQLRILKSNDVAGHATLQGVVVMANNDISPLRTREIGEMGDINIGYIDGTRAYGTFGAWRTDTVDLGINANGGLVGTTNVNRDNALYLWRLPSDNSSDATMLSGLNLGNHDIANAKFVNSSDINFDEKITVGEVAANDMIFQNRTTIDKSFRTINATVSGILSSDSRNMNVSGQFNLADTGKFTNFITGDLYVNNLTLGGISITDASITPAILKVNRAIDMTRGRITAMYTTVNFAGSITPRLVVHNRIEDSNNSSYYWDASSGTATAHLMDAILVDLQDMAPQVLYSENVNGTVSSSIFGKIVANKNATVSDYMNAINQIQAQIRAKYRQLNLE